MAASPRHAVGARGGRIGSERGSIIVLTAVMVTMLLGVTALAIDASFMYGERNRLYAAADAAAKSAALEYHLNTGAALQAFADSAVTRHGFAPGVDTTVTVNRPPTSGSYAGLAKYVEVIVSKNTNTFFGNILGMSSMTPTARAVAGTGNPMNCLITQQGLNVGNSTLTLNGCSAAVGGNLNGSNPNATIDGTPVPDVGVTGNCIGTCGAMGNLVTGAPIPIDPLAGLPLYPNPGGCIAGVAAVLGPGCYTSIAPSVTTLTSGLYYVNGPIDVDHLTGNGVMIFLTGAGQIQAANNKDLNLTAPSSGTYEGIAIFQDPSDANSFNTGNAFTLNVTGAIYMPGADVIFPNHLDFQSAGCFIFVARSLEIRNGSGNWLTNNSCAGLFGGAAFLGVSLAE